MTQQDDIALVAWLRHGSERGPAEALEAAFRRVRGTRQRSSWTVALAGGTIAERPMVGLLRYAVIAVAAALVAGVVAVALFAGGQFPHPVTPGPVPAATATPGPSEIASSMSSPSPSAAASEKPTLGLVAYTATKCAPVTQGTLTRTLCTSTPWLAASDGTSGHALGTGGVATEVLGWSADGSRLLVKEDDRLVVTDASGAEVTAIAMGCVDKASPVAGVCANGASALCIYPCAGADGFALSPDATRVAFVRSFPDTQNATVIAVLDLATRRITELASTRTTNPSGGADCYRVRTCEGTDDTPRWSPDGRSLVFARQTMSPDDPSATWTSAALYVVNADGSNLRRVTPTGMAAIDPSWSSDARRLVFTNTTFVVNPARTSVLSMPTDIFTISVDGTGLTRLTSDGDSALPDWTADGRVAFVRGLTGSAPVNWVMDAAGGEQSRPGGSLAELTAAGCTTCVYIARDAGGGVLPRAFWQPRP